MKHKHEAIEYFDDNMISEKHSELGKLKIIKPYLNLSLILLMHTKTKFNYRREQKWSLDGSISDV